MNWVRSDTSSSLLIFETIVIRVVLEDGMWVTFPLIGGDKTVESLRGPLTFVYRSDAEKDAVARTVATLYETLSSISVTLTGYPVTSDVFLSRLADSVDKIAAELVGGHGRLGLVDSLFELIQKGNAR